MDNDTPGATHAQAVDHRALAVAMMDISSDVHRKSLKGTGLPPLPNGVLEILRVIESHPGITVADVASRLGRQFSNVSTQLRELVTLGLVTRIRDVADKRYVTLHTTAEAARIKLMLETAWGDALEAATSVLSPTEQAQIQAGLPALRRLASVLEQYEPHGQHGQHQD